jgi:hypothetical protein
MIPSFLDSNFGTITCDVAVCTLRRLQLSCIVNRYVNQALRCVPINIEVGACTCCAFPTIARTVNEHQYGAETRVGIPVDIPAAMLIRGIFIILAIHTT